MKSKLEKFFRSNKIQFILLFIILAICILEYASISKLIKRSQDIFMRYATYRHEKYTIKQMVSLEANPIPANIEPWMTFAYINFVFNLPDDYLKSALDINSPLYPNISIIRYANMNNINLIKFLNQIIYLIENYLYSTSPVH